MGVRTSLYTGITLGSISAILLNLIFNVWGGKSGLVSAVIPVPRRPETLTIDQVNGLNRGQFVREFGGLFQGPPWPAEQAYEARPFADVYDLRTAFDTVIFEAPDEQQLALIRSYPDLGRVAELSAEDGSALSLSVTDQ